MGFDDAGLGAAMQAAHTREVATKARDLTLDTHAALMCLLRAYGLCWDGETLKADPRGPALLPISRTETSP